jgi:hypothetical protein
MAEIMVPDFVLNLDFGDFFSVQFSPLVWRMFSAK